MDETVYFGSWYQRDRVICGRGGIATSRGRKSMATGAAIWLVIFSFTHRRKSENNK